MELIDILGWISNLGFIIGAYLIAKKRVEGFYALALANFGYLIVGIISQITSLWGISVYLLMVNFYGIWNWKRK